MEGGNQRWRGMIEVEGSDQRWMGAMRGGREPSEMEGSVIRGRGEQSEMEGSNQRWRGALRDGGRR